MNSVPIIALLIIVPIFGFGMIALQIFLSLRKNKWFGMIIPAMDVLLIIGMVGIVLFRNANIVNIILLYLIFLVLALILHMVIYYICRMILKDRMNRRNPIIEHEMKKMQVKDL